MVTCTECLKTRQADASEGSQCPAAHRGRDSKNNTLGFENRRPGLHYQVSRRPQRVLFMLSMKAEPGRRASATRHSQRMPNGAECCRGTFRKIPQLPRASWSRSRTRRPLKQPDGFYLTNNGFPGNGIPGNRSIPSRQGDTLLPAAGRGLAWARAKTKLFVCSKRRTDYNAVLGKMDSKEFPHKTLRPFATGRNALDFFPHASLGKTKGRRSPPR